MIYVPDTSYKCYVVQSEGVIRSYEEMPQNNQDVNYRDYYINSNYIFRDGSSRFGSTTTLPVCLSSDILTDNYYYRNDFPDILLMFFIMSIFMFYIPFKILCRLFRRFN